MGFTTLYYPPPSPPSPPSPTSPLFSPPRCSAAPTHPSPLPPVPPPPYHRGPLDPYGASRNGVPFKREIIEGERGGP
jgi:hypothetical protein